MDSVVPAISLSVITRFVEYDGDDNDLLIELSRQFEAAEQKIKLVEHRIGDLVIPAVNELRYAGNHLLRAILATDSKGRREDLGKATGHSLRSMYDAAEAGL